MTHAPESRIVYRARLLSGGCWPAVIAFVGIAAFVSVQMYAVGYFGNPDYEHDYLEWMVILFLLTAGAAVGLSALGINAAIFAFIRPHSKGTTFLIGLAALPLAILAGIAIKALL